MPGQIPGTTYGVGYVAFGAGYAGCGPTVFVRDSVPACSNYLLPAGCRIGGKPFMDKNPGWYSIYCSKSGSLGFIINPEVQSDDYNWMLFDITEYLKPVITPVGEEPVDPMLGVYTDTARVLGYNWSEKEGQTGTSATAGSFKVCPAPFHTPPYPSAFSKMPQLLKEHAYLLLVSHNIGAVQSGYTLTFEGGTAVIADTATPHLLERAQVACDGESITVFLKIKTIKATPYNSYREGIRSTSLAPDGSDFKLLHTSVRIQSAISESTGIFMKKLLLRLSEPLKPGHYTLVLQEGSDGNTLENKCGKSIPAGDTLHFEKIYIPPVSMGSVIQAGCNAQSIRVAFTDHIFCYSVAKDGSDFSLANVDTGTPLAVTSAEGRHCRNDLTDTVQIYLAKPMLTTGTYRLTLQKGTDNNSVLSECDMPSPGQILTFESNGAVSALINTRLQYACNEVKVTLTNPGKNGINRWEWHTSSGRTGDSSALSFTDTSFRTQTVRLSVSNGICSDNDTTELHFDKDYFLHAGFTLPSSACPQDPVKITDESQGMHIRQWYWDFGNGAYGNRESPGIQHYTAGAFTKRYLVRLKVINSKGCSDTATKTIGVTATCEAYVPTAFTPNHDGENDYLRPLHIFQVKDFSFKVFNRWGQLVFRAEDKTHGWDGTMQGKPLPEGAYAWVLQFVNVKTGKKVFRKGSSLLIR